MSNTSDNEQELLRLVAAGDENAYRLLFDRYADRMYMNALHFTKSEELAQDLTQEIFIRIWVNRLKLSTVDRFDAWLFTVARNVIRNELKKKILPVENEAFLHTYFRDNNLTPQERIEYKELESSVHQAIRNLPPQMQTVFLLSRQEGLTHEEIALRMNISVVSSKTYMVRCLLAIRRHLGKDAVKLGIVVFFLFK
ncbi:sigma-70 family RNA polymerase sigma factor [Chitinophaga sp. Mgbs1]|uniref:Sigma-70 family RNA polymerase sigma factor n=1 Tax=Chitinophaga solisilvae TaxID=1233460 RepID=A0A3S1D6A2_9BACT|nr:sigma-70 family RNA polymerase sigma factor [Chitinophaga solisilvae]